jgi:hypothetical protein
MQNKVLFIISYCSSLFLRANIQKKSQSMAIVLWDLMIIGNFVTDICWNGLN